MARKQNELLQEIERLKKTIERSRQLIEEIRLVSRDLEAQTENGRKLMAKVPGNNFQPQIEQSESQVRFNPS